jgi:hypothetical protein
MATQRIVILSDPERSEGDSKDLLLHFTTLYALLYRTTPAWSTGQYTNAALP